MRQEHACTFLPKGGERAVTEIQPIGKLYFSNAGRLKTPLTK